ncbi:MAG: hypothetical protein CR982_07350 [Candidatus Cloacimonadota bacterium]|nr:MAG: hypothetical protein CR982_07350 [Candidatus Cloacimonadota bacterium]PIE79447.1 MAG: hypothetical protein CSA15_03075 [Candidatus Delongbacteria bacterium]
MKVVKTQHTENLKTEKISKVNSSDKHFVDMLKDFMKRSSNVTSCETPSENQKVTLDSMDGYSQLKINHLKGDEKERYMVNSILNRDSQARVDKIEMVKKRMETGFYSRDDVILETAGKILDEVDLDL